MVRSERGGHDNLRTRLFIGDACETCSTASRRREGRVLARGLQPLLKLGSLHVLTGLAIEGDDSHDNAVAQ